MQTKYTQSFKIEAVKKYFTKSIGTTYEEVASNLGISKSTLHYWVKIMKKEKKEWGSRAPLARRPKEWLAAEKLESILETQNLSESELNSYCRSKGIFPHHLQTWKQEFQTGDYKNKRDLGETKTLRAENKILKKELRRKNKALAEAAALLILKKKVQNLWGNEEDV